MDFLSKYGKKKKIALLITIWKKCCTEMKQFELNVMGIAL